MKAESPEPAPSPSVSGRALARRWRAIVAWQDRQIWIMMIGRLATAIAFSLFFPFLAIYLTDVRGVEFKQVGWLYFGMGLAGALSKVHGGILADRWGRKPTMVVALVLRSGSFAFLAYLVAVGAAWFWIGIVIVVSSYVGHFFIPASHAMIADLTEGRGRVDAFGLFRVATNLGWAVGPALGGFVPVEYYPHLLVLMALTYGGVGVSLAVLLRESQRPREKDDEPTARLEPLMLWVRHWRFHLYCFIIMLIYTVMGQLIGILSAFSVRFIGLVPQEIGYLFSLNGLLVVFLQVPMAALIRTSRMTVALIGGCLAYAGGYFIVGFAPGFDVLVVAIVVVTFGEMIVQPAGLTLASNLAPEDKRGRFLGVFGLFNHLGWSFGPALGGWSVGHFTETPWATWVGVSALAVVAAFGFLGLRFILPASADRAEAEEVSPEETEE